MHLNEVAVRSFQIRAGHVDVGTRQLAFVDRMFQIQVRVSFHASGSTHGGDAPSQIEAWRGECHLWQQYGRIEAVMAICIRQSGVIKVIVHAHESRRHRITSQFEHGHARAGRHVGAVFDNRNLATFHHNILIFDSRRARAVN